MVAQRSKGRAVSASATQAATWFSRWRSAFTGGTKRLFHKITITVPSALVAFTLVAISCTALWIEKPIVVNAFTVEASSGTAGLAADALADRLKARISQINADSGNLFQVRKLSDSNLPLDVKVGGTGLSVAAIAKALGIRFTTAEIAGHVAQIGNKLTLQFTVSQGVPVRVESPTPIDLPVPGTQGAEENFVKAVDLALDCFATKVMIMISPDVAANYLHTLERGSDLDIAYLYARQPPDCVHDDDVDLYSEVRKNPEAPPATQINALVGLSVHYGEMGEFYEEVNMAKAATDLASRLVPCEDSPGLSVWQRVKCTMLWKRSDTNRRAYIAAWMQLGAAYSDHASAAPNPMEVQRRRLLSMDAYRHLLRSTPKYALASDGLGIQQALLLDETGAVKTYDASLQEGESDAAHMDRGLTLIHGRRDSYVRLSLAREVLDAAEVEFRAAIRMNPNYWDAHARLGYVLFEQGRFRESAEVLEVALAHDRSNRPLRRLLGSVLADSCQFDAAKSIFNEAYQTDVALESVASAKINAHRPRRSLHRSRPPTRRPQ